MRARTSNFFGRRRETQIILNNVLTTRLTVLYAPSATGKTSILRGGVIPALARVSRTPVVYFNRWQALTFLRACKIEIAQRIKGTKPVDPDLPLDDLLAASKDAGTPIILLDQFEEYLAYHTISPQAEEFEGEFARAVNRPDVAARFLISLREDWVAGLDRFRARIASFLENRLRLEAMSVEQARQAVVGPLEVYNARRPAQSPEVKAEDELVSRVLADVTAVPRHASGGDAKRQQAGVATVEIAFLQLIMQSLWTEEKKDWTRDRPPRSVEKRRWLRLATYESKLGGAKRIVDRYLSEALRTLSAQERAISAALFEHLVTPHGTKIGHVTEDLVGWGKTASDAREPTIRTLLGRLTEKRILRRISPPERYEIFHDALAGAVLSWRRAYEESATRPVTARRVRSLAAGRAVTRAAATKRVLDVVAVDPAFTGEGGRVVMSRVEVPNESIDPGPQGYRVHVVDYDSRLGRFYRPDSREFGRSAGRDVSPSALLKDPGFHSQNVYALVMRTLGRFESSLGRRLDWGFRRPQLLVAPHAFPGTNTFYAPVQRAILFAYMPLTAAAKPSFSCLSHEIIAHETAHALLDGLRPQYTDFGDPEQAAFHEAFADIVGILSVLTLPEVLFAVCGDSGGRRSRDRMTRSALSHSGLRNILMTIPQGAAEVLASIRGNTFRRALTLSPGVKDHRANYASGLRRGEVLVAAVVNAFLLVWSERVAMLGRDHRSGVDVYRVVQEGVASAERILGMCIRAIDYSPPLDVQLGDFVSALLTADVQFEPTDSRFRARAAIFASVQAFGIEPTAVGDVEPGTYEPATSQVHVQTALHSTLSKEMGTKFFASCARTVSAWD